MVQHYRVRQNLVAIGDDFWIENHRGERVYKVHGKLLRVRKTLAFEDVDGNELCTIQERKLRIKGSMEIEDPSGSAPSNRDGRNQLTSIAAFTRSGDLLALKQALKQT
jgi:uncharacterized protein YxjI